MDTDPTSTVLKAIVDNGDKVAGAIVRVNISLPAEHEGQLNDSEIRKALAEAYYLTITRDIRREKRTRLGNWTAEEITPVEALKAYLEAKKVPKGRAKILLEYGEKLIQGQRAEQG
jgi:hypothetical protein